MQTFVDAGYAPGHLARVRGIAYVALGGAQLAAGFAAGGAASPIRTALVPVLVVILGAMLVARPHSSAQLHRLSPFFACGVIALGMVLAPPAIAPLGVGMLTISVLVGGLTLERGAPPPLVASRLPASRPGPSPAAGRSSPICSSGATLAAAAAIAIVTSVARRDAIDRVRVARRDAEELSLKDPDRPRQPARLRCRGCPPRRRGTPRWTAHARHRSLQGRANDEHGHLAGDEVLAEVGRRLLGALRRADLAARLGGDEFGVLVEGPLTIEGLRRVADAVRGATSAFAAQTPAGLVKITTSVGGALVPPDATAARQVRAARTFADRALYEAKKAGRDRAVIDGERSAPSARRGRRRPCSASRVA
ncbi:MAG: GGDEF domain-containing protein [Dehalococcoidia bacterium]